jgi:hypothetical protein
MGIMELTPKGYYRKLELPEDSVWDRKRYDPVLWLYHRKKEWPKWADNLFDLWFVPKRAVMDFFDFLKRLRIWIPVLWKDRDWDDSFIFEILKTKLITHRRYLVDSNRHTGIDATNRDITICLNLIERFQQSHYEVEHFDYYDSDIWFEESDVEEFQEEIACEDDDKQKLYEMKSKILRDNILEYIDKYPLDRKKTVAWMINNGIDGVDDYRENEESRQRLAMFMSQHRHQKCKRLIFLILSDKIEGWWD